MDVISFILIIDSVGLIIATFVLTYFFFRDILREGKEKK